jgi:hypothetical protein
MGDSAGSALGEAEPRVPPATPVDESGDDRASLVGLILANLVPLLCILVALKTAIDVYLHRNAHRKAQSRRRARTQP